MNSDSGKAALVSLIWFLFSKIRAGTVTSRCPASRPAQRPALACKPQSSSKPAPLGPAKCTWFGWGSDWQVWIKPLLRRRDLDVWHSTNRDRGPGCGWTMLPRYPLRRLGLEHSTDPGACCCGSKSCCWLQMALSCQDGWMESAGNRNYPCCVDFSDGNRTTFSQERDRDCQRAGLPGAEDCCRPSSPSRAASLGRWRAICVC